MAAAFRRWNARRRSPSMRALREAGPPIRWIVAAIPLALAAVIVLYVAGVENRAVLLAIPFVAFVLVGLIDRDGWRIRMAMAEVATRQREHWRTGTLPIDPPSADAWLIEHPDARPVERASVLVTAGRREEAIALLDAAVGETPTETVGIARLRLTLDPGGRRRRGGAHGARAPRASPGVRRPAGRRTAVPPARGFVVDRLAADQARNAMATRLRRRDPGPRALPRPTPIPRVPRDPAVRAADRVRRSRC